MVTRRDVLGGAAVLGLGSGGVSEYEKGLVNTVDEILKHIDAISKDEKMPAGAILVLQELRREVESLPDGNMILWSSLLATVSGGVAAGATTAAIYDGTRERQPQEASEEGFSRRNFFSGVIEAGKVAAMTAGGVTAISKGGVAAYENGRESAAHMVAERIRKIREEIAETSRVSESRKTMELLDALYAETIGIMKNARQSKEDAGGVLVGLAAAAGAYLIYKERQKMKGGGDQGIGRE
jgi:hypothetical protein